MYTIRLSKRAQEEVHRLNSSKKYLRLIKSYTSVVYQVVGSVDSDDEVIDCGGVLVLVDKKSLEYFNGAEIHYSDNPGWSYTKAC